MWPRITLARHRPCSGTRSDACGPGTAPTRTAPPLAELGDEPARILLILKPDGEVVQHRLLPMPGRLARHHSPGESRLRSGPRRPIEGLRRAPRRYDEHRRAPY